MQISVHRRCKQCPCADYGGCPSDFTFISSVNGCYKVVNRNLAWSAAGAECRRLHKDAHLLVINDAAEQSAVAGMLSSIRRQCYTVLCSLSHYNMALSCDSANSADVLQTFKVKGSKVKVTA